MDNDGKKGTGEGYGMIRSAKDPLFEREIISPGVTIQDVLAACYFRDEEANNNACQYLAQLEMFELEDEIRQALYKLTGNKSINLMSLKYAVQAHGGLFWDSEASAKDKEYLTKLQQRQNRKDEGQEERQV